MNRWLYLFLLLITVGGCATVPKPLAIGSFAEVTPRDVPDDNMLVGQRVRWGGSIVNTDPGKDETCFEISSRSLDRSARPVETDITLGRFIACAPEFYDPHVYAKGREVTIVGSIQGTLVRKLGEYEYRYPQINVETVYLWQKVVPYSYYGSQYPYYNGFGPYGYNPWGPWNSRFGSPYW
jgi:outer membrane lipoprotein